MSNEPTILPEADLEKAFPITSISRQDLLDAGFSYKQVTSLDDLDMEHLARKMADDYCDQMFWSSLEILAEGILEKGEENEVDES